MTATIIENNPQPYQRVEVDPITLDSIENALRNARFEMDAVLFRTAMSPGIREQHDEFPLIANLDGKMVVGHFGSFIYGFLENYDGTVEEGDIFLTKYAPDGKAALSVEQKDILGLFAKETGETDDAGELAAIMGVRQAGGTSIEDYQKAVASNSEAK